jgi:hypothetical protein
MQFHTFLLLHKATLLRHSDHYLLDFHFSISIHRGGRLSIRPVQMRASSCTVKKVERTVLLCIISVLFDLNSLTVVCLAQTNSYGSLAPGIVGPEKPNRQPCSLALHMNTDYNFKRPQCCQGITYGSCGKRESQARFKHGSTTDYACGTRKPVTKLPRTYRFWLTTILWLNMYAKSSSCPLFSRTPALPLQVVQRRSATADTRARLHCL